MVGGAIQCARRGGRRCDRPYWVGNISSLFIVCRGLGGLGSFFGPDIGCVAFKVKLFMFFSYDLLYVVNKS